MASMSKREGKVMPNIGAKRKRDPTFGASEKLTLISLVEQHFDVVESKKTDAVSMRQKAEEWRKLADTFNGTSSIHPREATVLKNCWENLKKRAKQELTQRNQSFMATGGGPPKKPNEDPAIDRVIDLIQARVSGFMNMYDSDGTNIASSGCDEPIAGTSQSVIVMSDAVIDNPQPTEIETTVTAENLNWAEYTPTMLRNPVNSELRALSPRQVDQSEDAVQEEQQPASATPLISSDYPVSTPRVQHRAPSTSRRRPTLRRDENLSAHRIATLSLANTQAAEEHEIKMRILRLQEEKEKEILKQERLKTRQEEIKLQILELELSNK